MSGEYWKQYWITHGRASQDAATQYQVLRTVNKRPVDDNVFARILAHIDSVLEAGPDDAVLDLCCGNGAITTHLACHCRSVVGIDCSPDLLAQIDTDRFRNLSLRVEDVAEAELPGEMFTKVLFYAGVQYFSEQQIVRLFCRIAASMRSGGRFYVGDIPDVGRIWSFHNTAERETAYFDSVRDDKPIIGTWLDPLWLSKLASHAGFENIRVLQQPEWLPFAHYRFDMSMQKP